MRPEKLHQLAKLIFKKYLRDSDGVLTALLPADTKRTIQRRLTNKRTTHDAESGSGSGERARPATEADIFDEAQAEALSFLSSEPYFTFLKSEVYLNYVAAMTTTTTSGVGVDDDGENATTASSSATSSVAGTRPTSQG